jgi:hypothetical protein
LKAQLSNSISVRIVFENNGYQEGNCSHVIVIESWVLQQYYSGATCKLKKFRKRRQGLDQNRDQQHVVFCNQCVNGVLSSGM